MSSLSDYALQRPRFAFLAALLLVLTGLWLALDFPSTEEPQVTIRTATVLSLVPGASTERMEDLVARPTEEAIRSIAEVKRIKTTVRPGFVFSYVELKPEVSAQALPGVWQRLRNRMTELQPRLPQGATGPLVDDEFGRVAVLTLGLTGPGYSAGELREQVRQLRDRLYRLDGVDRVSLHGLREEQVQVVANIAALQAKGLSVAALSKALAERNVLAPAGRAQVGGAELALTVSGDAQEIADLGRTPVALPGGGWLPLSQLARIERVPQDPASTGAFVDGQAAAVIAVAMDSGLNVISFAERLRGEVAQIQAQLPAGMQLVPITDQAQIVTKQLKQVSQVFLETTIIVMGVVVLFLGLRTGLIVGAIVPTTVLGSLVVMKLLGIELHTISIGAIIIALGLFVDNAIVVAEDMERRLALGEDRSSAAAAAGRTMFIPLLVSSLAIILTFMPLVLSQTETGEYLRSLGLVMAIALLLSLLLAVTVTPLLCQRFAHHHAELSRMALAVEALTGWYRGKVRWVLGHKTQYIGTMVALLAAAGWLFAHVPSELMPASERRQLQMAIELAPDTSGNTTLATAQRISQALSDDKRFPELQSQAVYVGDGGPRFILALNPPTPASHRAYAVLTLAPGYSHEQALQRLRSELPALFPEVRFEPKRFSMGSTESGTAEFRISSSDAHSHRAAAEQLSQALNALPEMVEVRSDAERQILHVAVELDQVKAAAAGISSAEVARSLERLLSGEAVTQFREGDTLLPVLVRGPLELRERLQQLQAAPLERADGQGRVLLGQIARVELAGQPSVLQRVDQKRVVTLSARHARWTAQSLADAVQPELDRLQKDGRVQIELGGEIEEGASANQAITALLPACVVAMFLLFVWQFESLRKSLIVMTSIPFVSIGAALALQLTGTTLTFVGTLGLLALAGIIVNNAVLLLDAIDEAIAHGLEPAAAIEDAASKRLRPIVMTKAVCILGLMPLYFFGGAVWTSLAVVMMGGLALGTLITLGLIPALYAAFYRVPAPQATVSH
ncbi:efflux RND transporter permease subunit [Paucibacter sp. DJ1R-11]|uniref:efflux RND transporter permease subunit n=1 Tax=Paucibacter sp. DJ1R-11 TaxID=2893556 RepID=UPI0021E4696E|nr:efflux RND transporter permease subunit [Paucibacter sp. DJ1R-11]MCV2362315.1 efflux RND transporter permease subunit [Paucibacter sp. DJ1R-11]